MTTLEAKRYVASDTDIRDLAMQTIEARTSYDKTKSTYMRALIATAQATIKERKTSLEDQWRVLKEIHQRFYAIVLEAVTTDDIKPAPGHKREERERRTHERNRRSNFARTANSVVTGWMKVPGHDLLDLKAATVTKNELRQEAAPRKPHLITMERAQARASKFIAGLLSAIKPFAAQDSAGAREVIEEAIRMLTAEARSLKPGAQGSTSPMVVTMTARRAAKNAKTAAKTAGKQTISKKAA